MKCGDLAVPVIVHAAAVVDAAKVEAQRLIAGRFERARRPINDFIMHRPAKERVRMQDERKARRLAIRRAIDGFELTVRCGNQKVALGIHRDFHPSSHRAGHQSL